MANIVETVIVRSTGEIVRQVGENLRTNAGKQWQANQMAGSPSTICIHMGVGGDASAPASADTDLVGEFAANGLSRLTGTFAYTASASTYTLSGTWVYIGSSATTVEKACIATGLTNTDTSADTHFCMTLLSPAASLTSGDTLTINWGIGF